jgi:hypothetical protein
MPRPMLPQVKLHWVTTDAQQEHFASSQTALSLSNYGICSYIVMYISGLYLTAAAYGGDPLWA